MLYSFIALPLLAFSVLASPVLEKRVGCKGYNVVQGDTCDSIASNGGISTQQLLDYNPGLPPSCRNLQINETLCLSTGGPGCTSYYVKQGDTCQSLADSFNISLDDFNYINKNKGINGDCTNLQIDQLLCSGPPQNFNQ